MELKEKTWKATLLKPSGDPGNPFTPDRRIDDLHHHIVALTAGQAAEAAATLIQDDEWSPGKISPYKIAYVRIALINRDAAGTDFCVISRVTFSVSPLDPVADWIVTDAPGSVRQAARNAVLARLHLYYSEAEARLWLTEPHPQLDGNSADDAIAAGQSDIVHAIIDRLESDGHL